MDPATAADVDALNQIMLWIALVGLVGGAWIGRRYSPIEVVAIALIGMLVVPASCVLVVGLADVML